VFSGISRHRLPCLFVLKIAPESARNASRISLELDEMTNSPQQVVTRTALLHIVAAVLTIAVAVAAASLFPVHHSESPMFASPAFQRTFVAEAAATTHGLDLWGSDPLSWRVEPYAGAPNNRRVVQYFERGRMEVETGSNQVTLGALAHELTTGEIDLGDGVVQERQSPEISIDSGEIDSRVPTYLTLSRFVGQRQEDRTGERITSWIDRSGVVSNSSTPQLVRFGEYVEESGHNIPDVTVQLFSQPEFQDQKWIKYFGYPITEPFWTEFRRKDEMFPSLVQVFERRILIYSPGLETSRAFTIGSSGRHYSLWRYGTEPDPAAVQPPEDALVPDVVLGDELEAWVYADALGTPIDLALSSTGHLMILTLDGRILKAESLDPDAHPSEFTVWAEGIDDPQGMVARGDSVVVTAGNEVLWFHDQDGRGVLGRSDDPPEDAALVDSERLVRGKPVMNSIGKIFARTDANGSGEVLREIASSEVLIGFDGLPVVPGPIEIDSGDLLLAGMTEEGRNGVILVPGITRAAEPGEPVKIATFPSTSSVLALEIVDEDLWRIGEFGDVIVAVQDEDGASLFALSRHRGLNETEMVELASGLSRPTAVQVGLDGSLYVADTDQERIIRIRYNG
jgi:hypothetical protein